MFGTRDRALRRKLQRACGELLRRLSKRAPTGRINIVFVSARYIHELNRRFLNRNRPTDVLSFPLDIPPEPCRKKSPRLVGEIYISREQARVQAKAAGIPLHAELLALARHGLLHLAGLTHRQMEKFNRPGR